MKEKTRKRENTHERHTTEFFAQENTRENTNTELITTKNSSNITVAPDPAFVTLAAACILFFKEWVKALARLFVTKAASSNTKREKSMRDEVSLHKKGFLLVAFCRSPQTEQEMKSSSAGMSRIDLHWPQNKASISG